MKTAIEIPKSRTLKAIQCLLSSKDLLQTFSANALHVITAMRVTKIQKSGLRLYETECSSSAIIDEFSLVCYKEMVF